MKTMDEVIEIMEARIDRQTLEDYISREWLRPVMGEAGWYFEEIDIARLHLVCHLTQDIQVNDEGIDIALSLLDQVYGLRSHVGNITRAINQQPPEIQTDIMMTIKSYED